MPRRSPAWSSCSLFGRRLSNLLKFHWRNLILLVIDEFNVFSWIDDYFDSVDCDRCLGYSWGKYEFVFPCFFKDFFLFRRSNLSVKRKDVEDISVVNFAIMFHQSINIRCIWAKAKHMAFELPLHCTVFILEDFFINQTHDFMNHLILVSLLVARIVFVGDGYWKHPSAYFQSLTFKIIFE